MTTALRRPRPALALALVSAALLLAGCSSGTADAQPTAEPDDSGADDGGDGLEQLGDGGELPGGNGVSGLIAAMSDSVLQVQSTDSQTAVTWTDETVVTRTVTVGVDAIAVGQCVFAIAPAAEEGSTATEVAATVTVSDPVDGECAAGFGGLGNFGGSGGPLNGELPEGFEPPEGMTLPEGGERPEDGELPEGMMGGNAFGQLVNGLVTAVSGTTLTVESTDADGVATTETIETDADTVVTTTVAADATALAVGLCASAFGEADTRGGMTATTIALSDPGENGCTAGMGARMTNRAGDE